MKIIVLNGSPKGDQSVTLQYVNYLIKKNPLVDFQVINIVPKIKRIEKDEAVFSEIIESIRLADGVIWAFPLYILLVHAQYKRFIELIFERGVQDAFVGKYAASISTSIHYFDHTAHNYIHAICDDLGMRFVDSFSPEMYDLEKKSGQNKLSIFGNHFLKTIQSGAITQKQFPAIINHSFVYTVGQKVNPVAVVGKKVVIIHDAKDSQSNLLQMVTRLKNSLNGNVTVMDLNEVEINGGCLGCLKCGSNYHCAYEGKDGFIDFYRSTVMAADIVVFAGTIKDRYLSSLWKTLFDRAFFNTHTPVLDSKQLGFLISGPFSQIPNLNEVFKGWAEFQMANLVGILSDEVSSSDELDQLIDAFSTNLVEFSGANYAAPLTFLGIGGGKIFRDDIWGHLRFIFNADHRAYQKMGLYQTFPQADWRMYLFNTFITPILQIKQIRHGFDQQVKPNMVQPLRKIVEKA